MRLLVKVLGLDPIPWGCKHEAVCTHGLKSSSQERLVLMCVVAHSQRLANPVRVRCSFATSMRPRSMAWTGTRMSYDLHFRSRFQSAAIVSHSVAVHDVCGVQIRSLLAVLDVDSHSVSVQIVSDWHARSDVLVGAVDSNSFA